MNEDEVRAALLGLVSGVSPDYLRRFGVSITSTQYSVRTAQREEVNRRAESCWECGTDIEQDFSQRWIADHIPPRKLAQKFKEMVWEKFHVRQFHLYPQCDRCASEQANLVQHLNKNSRDIADLNWLNEQQRALLFGGDGATCIVGTPNKPSPAERNAIQPHGDNNYCHCCGTATACSTYIADHFPPQEIMTAYAKEVFDAFEIQYPTEFFLIPHCRKCSSRQGPYVNRVMTRARELMHVRTLKDG